VELRHLEYFVAVAEERHFTRAAHRVHVAQSGLSSAIRSLERELGATLFRRNTRSVELTDAGRALLVEARHTLSAADAAREAVAAVQGVVTGSLVVGTQQCLGCLDLSALLARFHQAHPGVEVRLRQTGSADLVDQVRTGVVDVAFVSVPPDSAPVGVDLRTLASEPLVLACGPRHRLADADSVSLAELKEETFVDFHPGWITRDVTDQALRGVQVDRRVALEVDDVHFLLDLVGSGLGVAVVPHTFTSKRTRARFVPLRAPVPTWDLAIATARGRRPSAAARAFLADDAIAVLSSGDA